MKPWQALLFIGIFAGVFYGWIYYALEESNKIPNIPQTPDDYITAEMFNRPFRDLTDAINSRCGATSTPLYVFLDGQIFVLQDITRNIDHATETLKNCNRRSK